MATADEITTPPAEPPAEAVRVVVRGTLVQCDDTVVRVAFEDKNCCYSSDFFFRHHVHAIRSLLPAGWPRDKLGHAKAPLRPIFEGMDVNERLAALERWIDAVPSPPGGWRGRDRVAYDAITGMIRMFAPVRDMDASAWWKVQDAMAALAQLADEVEVTL